MSIVLKPVALPDFGLSAAPPAIPAAVFEARVAALRGRAVGLDWIVVYADREHNANIAFLTGFEPRFEEALLLLGPGGRRILVCGNESRDYAVLAGLPDVSVALCQTFSLMGQDRSQQPSLEAVLRDAGLAAGAAVGLVGWKYLGAEEWTGELPSFQAPALVVDVLRRVAGAAGLVADATPLLMHPETGLRAVVDIHQIALHEWGASQSSEAVRRVLVGARPGETDYAATTRMGYAGAELTCHTMLASSPRGVAVIGLSSPRGRVLQRGDGVSTAVGYWGGLSSRAGLLSERDDDFVAIARGYFAGLATWYETAAVGVAGGVLDAAVKDSLARAGLKPALNPGHLTGHDEWMHTPVRPGSAERIRSGMPFQVDVIPTPIPLGQALNCEDGVAFADAALQAELAAAYPQVAARIEARRRFMTEVIGVAPDPTLLPLSNLPLWLPPLWLASGSALARD